MSAAGQPRASQGNEAKALIGRDPREEVKGAIERRRRLRTARRRGLRDAQEPWDRRGGGRRDRLSECLPPVSPSATRGLGSGARSPPAALREAAQAAAAPRGSQRPGSHARRPPRPGSYSRHAPPGGFQTLTTASPPSPPACPSNRRRPAPHWTGPAPPRADWPRSSGPASALATTSILLVEAEGGRLSDVGWSAASSSALVGFVRSLPHLSLEREGGLDVEREPPQSELEVARTSLKLVC
uniref:proline-rich nuclear receptor coactivator 2 isoform X1 n=1 Tax=Ictidomys tridecemlineatus TaxID=43179 RepID=UPI001A9F7F6E|nr:proline-rich nuclear receptor coactivator 2 isoform X1 [Ictidomys tridecemlineatus]